MAGDDRLYSKKRYNKERIESLFDAYVNSGDEKIFGDLIEASSPIIDVVLKKYSKYGRHFEDIRQEVKLKMWKNLRDPKKLSRCSINPTAYLFFVIRAYVSRTYERFMKIYEDNKEALDFVESENWVSGVTQEVFLDPERQFIIDAEISQKMFHKFVARLMKYKEFKAMSTDAQKAMIMHYKEEIEFIFGVKLGG